MSATCEDVYMHPLSKVTRLISIKRYSALLLNRFIHNFQHHEDALDHNKLKSYVYNQASLLDMENVFALKLIYQGLKPIEPVMSCRGRKVLFDIQPSPMFESFFITFSFHKAGEISNKLTFAHELERKQIGNTKFEF
ncbi:MAG: hypothetical protein R3A45_11645 [Bdellovibrionota bacterium]